MADAENEYWLSRNLRETLSLPDDAVTWLLGLWNASQVFDDMADGDFPDRDRLNSTLLDCLVNLQANDFFLRHGHHLLPVVRCAVLKWNAADMAERAGQADARSFVWRAGFYDIVLMVVALIHGDDTALSIGHNVMHLYGESFDAYMAEVAHA